MITSSIPNQNDLTICIGCFTNSDNIQVKNEFWRRTCCSARDLAQLVSKCLSTNLTGFHIFYRISDNPRNQMDLTNTRYILGYQPQDRSESELEALWRRFRQKLGRFSRKFQ